MELCTVCQSQPGSEPGCSDERQCVDKCLSLGSRRDVSLSERVYLLGVIASRLRVIADQ